MKLALSDNRMQPGFGMFVILLYALYGAYISSLYILEGNKGSLGSKHFLLFLIVSLLLLLSNTGKLLIKRTIQGNENSLILLFIVYMMLRLLFVDSERQSYYIGIIFSELGTNFIAGFIAFSVLGSWMPIVSNIMRRSQNTKGIIASALLGTFFFFGCMLYFITQFLGGSLADVFQIRALSNVYYQDFGDLVTIGYCCLVSLQISYFKRNVYPKGFLLFSVMLFTQTILAFVCLQIIGSNKSVVTIALIFVLSIYLCKPQNWLIDRLKIKTKSFYIVPPVLFICLLLYRLLPEFGVYQLRIFDYGEGDSIFMNTSMMSRWQLIRDLAMDQLMTAPMFGDLSINLYMHSSLMSVQTHLGFIGSMLFWSFVVLQLRHVYGRGGNEGLKAIALPILFVSIISSFFSWGPLWFLVGALYAYTPQSQKQLRNLDIYKTDSFVTAVDYAVKR